MPVTIYESTDSGAPTLNGTVNSLVALLDACLVNGYGSKPGAGWTKPYTGTNKAAFRQGVKTDRLQMYLRVQDDAPGGAGGREARLRGFETMSDVDTGTGPFPTTAQLSAGIIARKSATADSTARAWLLAADHRTVTLFVLTGDAAGGYYVWYFGDAVSRVPGDQYCVQIIGRAAENTGSTGEERFGQLGNTLSVTLTGHYIARNLSGAGGSINNGKHVDSPKSQGSGNLGGGGSAYPDPAAGRLLLSRIDIHEPTAWRGWLRGVWDPLHSYTAFTNGDTFSGGGRTYRIIREIFSEGATGGIVLETSDTWDTD